MSEIFTRLFDTSDFFPRWDCGNWSDALGWLHIASDLGVWSAYVAIPCVLGFFVLKKKDVPFPLIFWLFGAFILACGSTHLMGAIIFWWPAYRLDGVLKLFTAVVSWGTVLALVPVTPKALAMSGPEELERRVAERTAELARVSESLGAEILERRRVEETLREQREWFRVTLSSIGDAVIVAGLRGEVSFMNPAAEALTGWNLREAEGRRLEEVLAVREDGSGPEGAGALSVSGLLRQGPDAGYTGHGVLTARDGREIPIEEIGTPIRGDGDSLLGVVLVLRDVSERRRAERVLRESEEQFRNLADSIPQLAWMTGPDGTITWYNRRWYEFTGKPPEDVLGWGWQSVHDPKELPRVVERFRAAIETGEPWEDTFPLRRYDGAMRWHLSRALPIRDEGGRVVRWFGTNTDITDRMEMEEALKQANRHKDEFLATLAHELRNPLVPIRNSLEILQSPAASPDDESAAIEMAARQVRHMARMLDDLLHIARISRGRLELRVEPVDLIALVSRAVHAVDPLFHECGHGLTVTLPSGPLVIDGDPTRLEQVVVNLLNNAAKYTEAGGEIAVELGREDGEVVLRIRDNGIGIAPEMLTRVFDLFVQAERRVERSRGGVGIGLTLVRKLVELHGGAVEAYSEGLGRGSEFVVRLPAPAPRNGERRLTAREPDRLNRASSRHRVLVVDDNVDAAVSLGMLLKLAGQEVRVAYDGPAALRQAMDFRPQLVLLDIGMPGMDGYEVCRRIRRETALQSATVVALTGWGQDEDRRRSHEAGFDHHIVKPVEPSSLHRLLDDLPPDEAAPPQPTPTANT
ncbi:MAG: PAS domain-containing hybrid sensor histidine kinase/response regulator [Isosphaeraceae bacterium]